MTKNDGYKEKYFGICTIVGNPRIPEYYEYAFENEWDKHHLLIKIQ